MAFPSSAASKIGNSFRARGEGVMMRVNALSPIAGGPLGAALLMLHIRARPDGVHSAAYNGKPVLFRSADEMALREVLIDKEYDFIGERLKAIPAPRVIDIGAHIGTFAIWLAGVNAAAALTCVEADPATFALTERNLGAHLPSAHALHRAGGADDASILRLSVDGPSMSHRIDAKGGVEVRSISLSTLVELAAGPTDRVDMVKIDIEGSEEALLCADPGVLRRIDALVVELHPSLCDTAAVREVLDQHYGSVVEIGGRKSSKPLLYCQGNTAFPT